MGIALIDDIRKTPAVEQVKARRIEQNADDIPLPQVEDAVKQFFLLQALYPGRKMDNPMTFLDQPLDEFMRIDFGPAALGIAYVPPGQKKKGHFPRLYHKRPCMKREAVYRTAFYQNTVVQQGLLYTAS